MSAWWYLVLGVEVAGFAIILLLMRFAPKEPYEGYYDAR